MTTKAKEYPSQIASRDVHEGGRYVIKNGKPIKEEVSAQAENLTVKKESK